MYDGLAKDLKKNTTIMTSLFQKNNLEVLSFSYRPYSDDDADCEMLIEISTCSGRTLTDDVAIKVNLYDSNDEICFTEEYRLYADEFEGYDTLSLALYDNGKTLLKAKSARLFVTRN